MALDLRILESVLFGISLQKVDALYSAFEADLIATIAEMRALGISEAEIVQRLTVNLNNGADLFGRFKGGLMREVETLVNMTAQGESNVAVSGVGELEWTLDPTVKEHCDSCKRNSLMTAKPFEAWVAIGLPGFGNTECGNYCRCTLEEYVPRD